MSSDIFLIAALIALFAAAVFFAIAETSLIRIPRVRAISMAEKGDRGAGTLVEILENLSPVLNAILLGALLSQIGAATVTGLLAQRMLGSVWVSASSVALTIVLFIYAEAIPKTYAVRNTDRVAKAVAIPVRVFERALRPLVALLVWLADLQMPGKGITTSPTVTEDELRKLASRAADEGQITLDDLDLIERAFRFGDRGVDDVMVPRTEIVGVPSSASISDALATALQSGHRRIAVFEESVEHIAGVVRVRDLIRVPDDDSDEPVAKIMTPPLVVPESKRVVDLLVQMRDEMQHMAVVVDEYGGTAGLVTIEDIAEELIGAFSDEAKKREVVALAGGSWSVPGTLPIEDLADLIDDQPPMGEWNTVAGFILHELGHMARVGDEVVYGAYVMRVTAADERRIQRVEVASR